MNDKWNVVQESLYNIDWEMKINKFYSKLAGLCSIF